MNLRELLAQLNAMAEKPENLDKTVEISVWNGLNTWPGVGIESTFEGFDWGHNRLFIIPVSKLVIHRAINANRLSKEKKK